MIEVIIEIQTNSIKLSQLVKYIGVVNNGSEAKNLIKTGLVKVNGIVKTTPGTLIIDGDIIKIKEKVYEIKRNDEN